MCVTSMIMDHYHDRWWPLTQPGTAIMPTITPLTFTPSIVLQPQISAEELAEFRRLLERAREYDKRMHEPDCELAEKKETLKQIARQLGVEIGFLDEATP